MDRMKRKIVEIRIVLESFLSNKENVKSPPWDLRILWRHRRYSNSLTRPKRDSKKGEIIEKDAAITEAFLLATLHLLYYFSNASCGLKCPRSKRIPQVEQIENLTRVWVGFIFLERKKSKRKGEEEWWERDKRFARREEVNFNSISLYTNKVITNEYGMQQLLFLYGFWTCSVRITDKGHRPTVKPLFSGKSVNHVPVLTQPPNEQVLYVISVVLKDICKGITKPGMDIRFSYMKNERWIIRTWRWMKGVKAIEHWRDWDMFLTLSDLLFISL